MYLFGAVSSLAESRLFGQGAAGDTAKRFCCNSALALFAGLDAVLMVALLAWHLLLIGHDVTTVRTQNQTLPLHSTLTFACDGNDIVMHICQCMPTCAHPVVSHCHACDGVLCMMQVEVMDRERSRQKQGHETDN